MLDLTRRVSEITGVEVPIIVGSQSLFALTGRQVAVICRLKETGNLLFITAYALE
ncbi:MAG: hypothetical protein M3430_11160 [Acidobacteriota bacterium]|nr:hypothetical protein [Acidobacteriota bacterium]